MSRNEKRKVFIVNIVIIFFLLVFFIKICPIVPYDQDDWIYLGKIRMPIPIWIRMESLKSFTGNIDAIMWIFRCISFFTNFRRLCIFHIFLSRNNYNSIYCVYVLLCLSLIHI